MKAIQKLIQKVIKCRKYVRILLAEKEIVTEWLLFGKFIIRKSHAIIK